MRTLLYRWTKGHSVMLVNAGSLIMTSAVTSVLGFAYWWLAARLFPPQTVGLASAALSAMMLIGNFAILGLGTMLIGELPRQRGKEFSLITAALILSGAVGGVLGLVFALVAPLLSVELQALGANVQDVVLFAAGVSLTAITLVFDQAVIGLWRSDLQLWRNTLLAVAKLVLLVAAGLWLSHTLGLTIYATWAAGNALSLVALVAYAVLKGNWLRRTYRPHWGLLRKLGLVSLQHHLINLTLQAPSQVLPILVTVLLSATINAWFYVSLMLANFVYLLSLALTTVLYAANSDEPDTFVRQARLTLGLSIGISVLANAVLLFGTKQVLSLFGQGYVEQAAWSLRILALGAFPLIIKNHYIAVRRIQGRLASTLLPVIACALLELGAATLGARLGDLTGLSLAWIIALCVEAVYMFGPVYHAVRFIRPDLVSGQGEPKLQAYTPCPEGTHEPNMRTNATSLRS